jgi:hypothetical protein
MKYSVFFSIGDVSAYAVLVRIDLLAYKGKIVLITISNE